MLELNKKIAVTAILATFSIVLYFFIKFPLPMLFPAFLDIQISNLPAVIGGFLLGPVYGSLIVVIRYIVKLPFSSTQTIGELADLLIGLSVVLSSSLIYKFNHTKKGATIALIVSSFVWIGVSLLINYYILVPFFIELFFKGNISGFVSACKIIPGITEDNYLLMYLLYAVLPFNLLLSTIVNVITFLVYKRLSTLLKIDITKPDSSNAQMASNELDIF